MNTPLPLVCLITPGHLASAPRIVKEADALHGAGYRVHVVAGRHYPPVDRLDQEILSSVAWESTLVDYRRTPGASARKLLQRAARMLVTGVPLAKVTVAARAQHAAAGPLAAAAAKVSADLFVGHCLAGLPAAANAARARGTRFGFDAEDLHEAETDAVFTNSIDRALAQILQSRLLPGCHHRTAASPLIGAELQRRYGVPFTTVLNVFPLAHAPATSAEATAFTADRPARVYWFSQTIGPGRGLEAVVKILSQMRTPVELQLRGFPATGFPALLQQLATASGLTRSIAFLPPGPAAEMVRLAAEADLGLSTEESHPLNREFCLTNKIFAYLLAGIPQFLSATAAQRAIATELGAAAVLADLRQTAVTARLLDDLLVDHVRLASARRTASELAHRRYCWEVEQQTFLASIRGALA